MKSNPEATKRIATIAAHLLLPSLQVLSLNFFFFPRFLLDCMLEMFSDQKLASLLVLSFKFETFVYFRRPVAHLGCLVLLNVVVVDLGSCVLAILPYLVGFLNNAR